jgi:hypothetical protein
MRGRNITYSIEFNGHRRDDCVLTCLSSGSADYWSIDVPTVLWILERVAAGHVDARIAQDELRRATRWDSGCCGECDVAAPHYAEARRLHEGAVRRWTEEQQRQLDPEDYPFLLNKGKIHTLRCERPPKPAPPEFPEDLHAFAVQFDGNGGTLDSFFDALDRRSPRGAQQISVAEVLGMMARDGVATVTARLCRACRPSLPKLDPSAVIARPACWAWSAHPAVLDHLRVIATRSPSTEASILPEQRMDFAMLEHWHDGRCAICGEVPGSLARDHDHETGLIRGLLCSPCNTAEARTASLLFDNYRLRSPAAILTVEVLYLPAGFRPGTRHLLPAHM